MLIPPVHPTPGLPWSTCTCAGFGPPIGSVIAFAGKVTDFNTPGSPPGTPAVSPVQQMGWMVCDGRELKQQDYPALYAALGDLYGGGSGTFRIPNFQGYFLRGVNSPPSDYRYSYQGVQEGKDPETSTRTSPPGGEVDQPGSTQGFALQTHVHEYEAAAMAEVTTEEGPDSTTQQVQKTSPPITTPGEPDVQVSTEETRPVNIYVYYLIKYI